MASRNPFWRQQQQQQQQQQQRSMFNDGFAAVPGRMVMAATERQFSQQQPFGRGFQNQHDQGSYGTYYGGGRGGDRGGRGLGHLGFNVRGGRGRGDHGYMHNDRGGRFERGGRGGGDRGRGTVYDLQRKRNFDRPQDQPLQKGGTDTPRSSRSSRRLQVDYYFENGLRKVYPYYFTFYTTAQRKWEDKLVLDVFTEEFPSNTKENYAKAIESGDLLVNDQRVPLDYKLRLGDTISSKTHRHENPVLDLPIEIIYEDRETLVVKKPPGIPCQPSGRFKTCSVLSILQNDLNINFLKNMYHLDWQSSGLMIFGKNKNQIELLEHQDHNGLVRKEFLARVQGEFPFGKVVVGNAQEIVSHKLSLWKIQNGGKPSQTIFERVSYNGKSTLVRCIPEIGRTAHQIRVHLQYMGHPIINDPVYNNEAWGPNKGKGAQYERPMDEVIEELSKTASVGRWLDEENPLLVQKLELEASQGKAMKEESVSEDNAKPEAEGDGEAAEGEMAMDTSEPLAKRVKTEEEATDQVQSSSKPVVTTYTYERKYRRRCEVKHQPFTIDKWNYEVNCAECKHMYVDPKPEDMLIYLHALKFESEDWEYYTEYPTWAKEGWEGDCQQEGHPYQHLEGEHD